MSDNAYVNALNKTKIGNAKISTSPKRMIVQNQKDKCYMCEKSLGTSMCHYAIIQGPDMRTGVNSKEMRALCPQCFFRLDKNPVKQVRKKTEIEREPTRKELEETDINDYLD
jgi:PP-loop superfamily ATP-utilizing enzyme